MNQNLLDALTSPRLRIGILIFLSFLLFSALAIRLWNMQVVRREEYREKSERQSVRTIRIPPIRGRILARNGTPLADNRVAFGVRLHPAELREKNLDMTAESIFQAAEETAKRAGRENPLTREMIRRHLNHYPGIPLTLFPDLPLEDAAKLWDEMPRCRGLEFTFEPVRNYPYGSMAAHLLGYTGRVDPAEANDRRDFFYYISDPVGRSGLEKRYDEKLRGTPGRALAVVNSAGFVHEYLESGSEMASNGLDLCLTLDFEAQSVAEGLLNNHLGAIVLLNAENGEILAMASSPRFDPNLFTGGISAGQYRALSSDPALPFLNRAAAGSYIPGSIIKPLTAIAAMHAGIPPEEIFQCTGSVPYGYGVIHCMNHAVHGRINLYDAIKKSCNCYFVTMALRTGIGILSRVLESAGIGSATGFELAEQKGILPENSPAWLPEETAYVAFGQGKIALTPLQAAVYTAAIANGGTRWKPYLVSRILDTSQNTPVSVYDAIPESRGRLDATPEMLEVIRDAMHRVVWDPGGSGSRAQSNKIELSGKTGTADVSDRSGKYKNAWFIGFGRDPRKGTLYAIAVLIEHGESGGLTAARIAGQFFDRWL